MLSPSYFPWKEQTVLNTSHVTCPGDRLLNLIQAKNETNGSSYLCSNIMCWTCWCM